jgi:hypothetical protein
MPGRADERERLCLHRGDRGARREQRRFVRRFAADRIDVEPGRLGDRADSLDVLAGVTARDRLGIGGAGFVELELGEERLEPRRRLRMRPGRMQPRERRMA